MNALVNLIIRVVLSLGFTIAMAVVSNNRPNIVEFVLMWLLLHIAITLYYYILKIRSNRSRIVFVSPILRAIWDYFLAPLIIIAVILVVVPEGIACIFPESWQEIVQAIIGIAEFIGLLVYDISNTKRKMALGE